ncbi:MAG TPA: lysophospholipid acyltransferase family protein [Gemmatimonadaceae bacterium]|nr:lysophospholipid acyltransferase family protein [Gemmatimonadaceae bacterium]
MSAESATDRDAARERKRARKLWWSVTLGRPLVELLGSTWRVEERNAEAWQRLKAEGQPYLLAVWHGQLLSAVWGNRHRDISALASTHGDAEIIARMMHRWGYRFVRGSSSQGGREALVQIVEGLKQGDTFAFTPDGPRGPRGVPKPGLLVASMRSGAPIIGIRCEISRAWRMGSWDRFAVPKPFARLRLTYSDPWVAPDASDASVAELQRRLGPPEAGVLGGAA